MLQYLILITKCTYVYLCSMKKYLEGFYISCLCCQNLASSSQRQGDSFGWSRKSSFYCFARQREPQWVSVIKTMWPTVEGVVRSLIVAREQGVISSWTVLGLVDIKVKFQASSVQSRAHVLLVSSFHLEGVCFLLQILGICVRPLSISFRKLWVEWFCHVAEL